MVLEEESLTKETFLSAVQNLYTHRQDYIHAMEECPQSDAIGTIMGLLNEVTTFSKH